MAELDTSGSGQHKKGPGVKKSKKLSTRIDLTPMVDLGFLLITFFMYTTTLAQPKTMEIQLPFKPALPGQETEVKENTALTILISKDHFVYTYEGKGDDPRMPPVLNPVRISKSTEPLREVILAKKASIDRLKATGALRPSDEIVVLIKPDSSGTFKDLVDVFDEMTVSDVKIYPKADITAREQELISQAANSNNR